MPDWYRIFEVILTPVDEQICWKYLIRQRLVAVNPEVFLLLLVMYFTHYNDCWYLTVFDTSLFFFFFLDLSVQWSLISMVLIMVTLQHTSKKNYFFLSLLVFFFRIFWKCEYAKSKTWRQNTDESRRSLRGTEGEVWIVNLKKK